MTSWIADTHALVRHLTRPQELGKGPRNDALDGYGVERIWDRARRASAIQAMAAIAAHPIASPTRE